MGASRSPDTQSAQGGLDVVGRLGPGSALPGLCWRISDTGHERWVRRLGTPLWLEMRYPETRTRRRDRRTLPEGLMGTNHQYVSRQRPICCVTRFLLVERARNSS